MYITPLYLRVKNTFNDTLHSCPEALWAHKVFFTEIIIGGVCMCVFSIDLCFQAFMAVGNNKLWLWDQHVLMYCLHIWNEN